MSDKHAASAGSLGLDLAGSTVSSFARFATGTDGTLRLLALTLLRTLGGGFGLGLTVGYASIPSWAAFAQNNTATTALRRQLLLSGGGGAAAALALVGVVALLAGAPARAMERAHQLSCWLVPAGLLFPLALLLTTGAWSNQPVVACLATAAWGLSMEAALGSVAAARGLVLGRSLRPRRPWLALGGAALIAAVFAVYFSYFTLQHHHQLRTASFDLGIFDNLMWNLLRGEWFYAAPVMGWTGSHLKYHATFIFYLLLPFYAIAQRAEALLVIQAVLCGSAIIPLFLLARDRIGSQLAAITLCIAYALYQPQHGPIFYDFHDLTIASPFVLWTAYLFETRFRWAFAVACCLALLAREDVSLGLMCIFAFHIATGRRVKEATSALIGCALYFVAVKFVIMPLHATRGDQSFTYIYKELIPDGESGFGAVIKTLLTNPLFGLRKVFTEKKLVYALQLFVPLLFAPLRRPVTLLLLGAGFVLTLLSTGYDPVIETRFQYTTHWTAYIFIATIYAIEEARSRLTRWPLASTVPMALSALVLSVNFGALNRTGAFEGGFSRVDFTWDDADATRLADLRALIALIPPDASVAASEREAPHVSNRKYCFTLRYTYRGAEYILTRIEDGRAGGSHESMRKALAERYGHVATRGAFQLWRQGHRSASTPLAAAALGLEAPPK